MQSRAGVAWRDGPAAAGDSEGAFPRVRSGSATKYELKGVRRQRLFMLVAVVTGLLLLMSYGTIDHDAAAAAAGPAPAGLAAPLSLDVLANKLAQAQAHARTHPKIRPEDYPRMRPGQGHIDTEGDVILDGVGEYPVGWARIPRLAPGADPSGDDRRLHVVFSSACNNFQHWQSELVLASAKLVGQRGRITRIVSGCHDKDAESVRHRHQTFPAGKNDLLVPMAKLNRSLNDEFGLFVTPSFPGAKDFPWLNKPNSINFFMEHARPELDRLGETVIAILDPDFLFLKPLVSTGIPREEIIASRGQGETDPSANRPVDVVKKGRPVAQRYGLEGHQAQKFDLAEITGDPASPALEWTQADARRYTSVGPPLMLHVDDITELAVLWAQYMGPVLARDKDILADMWAYSTGAMHLGLRHTTLDHYMVSTHGRTGQGFEFIDAWESMSCLHPQRPHGKHVPVFIHMASNFKAPDRVQGPWMFHKGHVPASILECDTPLLVDAPDDLWEVTKDPKAKQHAWILCHIVATLNKVALEYKRKFCPVGFEERKLVRLVQHKSRDRGCNERDDPFCWPLAQIEGLPDDWRANRH